MLIDNIISVIVSQNWHLQTAVVGKLQIASKRNPPWKMITRLEHCLVVVVSAPSIRGFENPTVLRYVELFRSILFSYC